MISFLSVLHNYLQLSYKEQYDQAKSDTPLIIILKLVELTIIIIIFINSNQIDKITTAILNRRQRLGK